MKKSSKTLLIVVLCLVAILSLSGVTYAWLSSSNIETKVDGSVYTNYFEDGTGTSSDPFIISTPRQLYNLAWMQYMGLFNQSSGGEISQFYFELGADIDMSMSDGTKTSGKASWVLPPIGTTQYPFVGSFDGNGHTISNLVVSGTWSELSDGAKDFSAESNFSNSNTTGSDIVGLFGVIGAEGKLAESGDDGKVSIGDDGPTYIRENNAVKDFTVDNITVKTGSGTSLVGIVAGYVNGSISGVRVADSNVVVPGGTNSLYTDEPSAAPTKNISDYATIGFAEDPYKSNIEISNVCVSEPTVKLETKVADRTLGDKWGGSIIMKDLFDRLDYMEDNAHEITLTYSHVEEEKDAEGNVVRTVTTVGSKTLDDDRLIYNTGDLSGAVTFSRVGDNQYRFVYSGKLENDRMPVTITYKVGDSEIIEDGYFVITDSNDHFMTVITSGPDSSIAYNVGNADSFNDAFSWSFVDSSDNPIAKQVNDADGKPLYIGDYTSGDRIDSFSGYIKVRISENAFKYLTISGSDLVLSDTMTTVWDCYNINPDPSQPQSMEISNGDNPKYYISYNEIDGWCITETDTTKMVLTDNKGNYLSLNGTNIVNTTNKADATVWNTITIRVLGDNLTFITTTINSQTYYLCASDSGALTVQMHSTIYTYYSDVTNWFFDTDDEGKLLIYTYKTDEMYLKTSEESGNVQWKCEAVIDYYFYYTEKGTTYYLNINKNNTQNTNSVTPQYFKWDDDTLYTTFADSPGARYYLYTYDVSLTRTFGLTSNREDAVSLYIDNNNYLRTSWGLYLRFHDNEPWTATTVGTGSKVRAQAKSRESDPASVSFLIKNIAQPAYVAFIEKDNTLEPGTIIKIQDSSVPYYTPYTYLPLITGGKNAPEDFDGEEYSPYPALNYNTGYLMSGTTNNNGDVRVSKYEISYDKLSDWEKQFYSDYAGISNSYVYTEDGGEFKTIYAMDTLNGIRYASDDTASGGSDYFKKFVKYNDSSSQLLDTLGLDHDYVYGLHFMNAAISKDNTFYADHVLINGNHFYNYELPNNCIDCNLKTSGYINFFAGTYYTKESSYINNSFFSLYKIERNTDNSISSIHQIDKIYGTGIAGDTLVYLYEDGSYSVPREDVEPGANKYSDIIYKNYEYFDENGTKTTKQMTMKLVYDMDYVENPASNGHNLNWSNYYLYYYEIPVNSGEYALGSVSGRNGAYLIYLDISTSNMGAKYQTTTNVVTTYTNEYNYPKGVQIVDKSSSDEFDDLDSASVTISSSCEDERIIKISRKDNEIYVSDVDGLSAGFVGAGIKLFTATFSEDNIVSTDDPLEAIPINTIITSVETKIITEINELLNLVDKMAIVSTTTIRKDSTGAINTSTHVDYYKIDTNTEEWTKFTEKEVEVYENSNSISSYSDINPVSNPILSWEYSFEGSFDVDGYVNTDPINSIRVEYADSTEPTNQDYVDAEGYTNHTLPYSRVKELLFPLNINVDNSKRLIIIPTLIKEEEITINDNNLTLYEHCVLNKAS